MRHNNAHPAFTELISGLLNKGSRLANATNDSLNLGNLTTTNGIGLNTTA